MKYAHILMAVASEIWAMQPEKMLAIIELLATQADGIKFAADEIEARIAPQTAKAVARREGAVAIIPMRGVISNRMNLMGNVSGGGGTSAEQLAQQLKAVRDDDGVKAVILDTDTPGGAPLCVFDVLRRYLEWRGWNVTFVQNFTDIDDKLIHKANDEGITVPEVAARYIAEFWKDANGLNVREADVHPKATENIEQIIDLISTLIEKGFAYESAGDVYFRAQKFEEYGKLSRQPLDDLVSGARVGVSEQKENPLDFALWKAAKAGEPFWDSPFGNGRPGWHIECSAMARRYLGETIDIHCGGQDLIFPHHENEIAQSECVSGKTFARYWMHNGYINVDNRKMSKSLGNFFTVRDVAEQYGYEPIRFLMISAHYRSPIQYSTDLIQQSKSALDRLYNCRSSLDFALPNGPEGELPPEAAARLEGYENAFISAMDDDLNTADAIGVLFELVRDINAMLAESGISRQMLEAASKLFAEFCDVLGILPPKESAAVDAEIEELIRQRTQARAEKNYAQADAIRDKLSAMGVTLEDTAQGVKWKIGK